LGSTLAAALDDEVVVVNVYPYDPLANSLALGAPPDEAFLGLAQDVVEQVADLPPSARRLTRSARSVASGLHLMAHEVGAEVLVVGSSHRGTVGQAILGTNATRAAHGAPCAVAVAPRGLAETDWAPHEIAVAYDATREADEALAFARRLAAATGAALRLVDVVTPTLTGWGWYVPTPDDTGYRDATRRMTAKLKQAAHEGETIEIRSGIVADQLLMLTSEVDLLVVGSRSYGPVMRTILGSTSDAIVHRADCPVVVVPRSAHEDGEPAQEVGSAAPVTV
jgi:nucleotide-binding universal stress UspA family protein